MGGLKIWWVLAGENYYPNQDNFLVSFETEEEANAYKEEIKSRYDWIYIIDISSRVFHG